MNQQILFEILFYFKDYTIIFQLYCFILEFYWHNSDCITHIKFRNVLNLFHPLSTYREVQSSYLLLNAITPNKVIFRKISYFA